MMLPQPLLAKSRNNGGTPLVEHTRHVMQAIAHLAPALGFDPVLAQAAAALHDTGKAHPKFQVELQIADKVFKWPSDYEKRQWDFVHRHELSSLLLLPCFPREHWDALIEMVVAHHKSVEDDVRKRGLLDLVNEFGSDVVLRNHLKDWELWSPPAIAMLRELGFDAPDVSREAAAEAWEYALDYCYDQQETRRWSQERGLLMAADHFASAVADGTAEKVKPTFQVPDVAVFEPRTPGGLLFPLSDVPVNDPRTHTLVVAPTGAGKTNFLMRRCAGRRIFYTLPFQASINAMWKRFCEAMPETPIRLQHAASRLVLKQDDPDAYEDEFPLHGMVGASVKVLTPHQLATLVFGLPGFESVMLDVRGTAVILDEIHTYSDVSRSMVLEIVKALLKLDCAIHIGTATMPAPMYRELLALLGGPDAVYEVALQPAQLESYNRHRVHKLPDWDAAIPVMEEAMEAGEKVLIVCNTVKKAQEVFQQLEERFGDCQNMLIHSRFRRKDRAQKEQDLREVFEGTDGVGTRPCWVVATQVVEVSLDISFDRMITACAPIDALIQRFGRINRRRTLAALGTQKPVYVIAPEGKQLPYNGDVVRTTFALLPDNGNILEEQSLQALLDAVYPELPDNVAIDEHLIWRNGAFALPPLCNRSASVLQDTLEIDSASCILECDQQAYESAHFDERAGLEIPVSRNAIAWTAKTNNYVQSQVGSKPFVVPQREEEHLRLGLMMREHNTFL